MQVRETGLPGVVLIQPRVFRDARGFFLETYHADRYAAAGIAGAVRAGQPLPVCSGTRCAACTSSGGGRRASWSG